MSGHTRGCYENSTVQGNGCSAVVELDVTGQGNKRQGHGGNSGVRRGNDGAPTLLRRRT